MTTDTRQRVTRWVKRVGLSLLCLAALAMSTGASYETFMRHRTAHVHPPRGRLIDIGGRRLQLDCRGAGSPTVVLEAGLDPLGSLSWAAVHDAIARTTRVCAYSRAGILWSDAAPGPFDAGRVPRDLHAALTAAGERAPFVLVGHSLGGPYVTLFTRAYPSEVAGLVFVDASHPEQFARFFEATGRSMTPPTGLVAAGSAFAWTGLVRLVPAGDAPVGWPVDAVAVSAAYLPTSLAALHAETVAVDATLAAEARARELGGRPLVVLTGAAEMSPERLALEGITRAESARMQAAWAKLQADAATWSREGRHVMVRDASHYIQFDRPDVVIGAVREVVMRVRTGEDTVVRAVARR
jgi:pimeloyl-ACP methyl ester carboxylesterase